MSTRIRPSFLLLSAGLALAVPAVLIGCDRQESGEPSATVPTSAQQDAATDAAQPEQTGGQPGDKAGDQAGEAALLRVDNGWYDRTNHTVYLDTGQTQGLPPSGRFVRVETGWYDRQTHRVFRDGDNSALTDAQRPGASDDAAPADGWAQAEAHFLTDHVQLTDAAQFSRAGEAYFSPDARWIVFQASPRDEMIGEQHAPYAMYVAKVERNSAGLITGIEPSIRVSPEGSSNTCGWFHPDEPWRIIFGSTITTPSNDTPAGFQRGTSRYRWAFPVEMEVVTRIVPEIYQDAQLARGLPPKTTQDLDFPASAYTATPLFERPGGYDAECAYSPDGRFIVYSSIDPETGDGDLWIHDTVLDTHIRVVEEPGYDGGPFFSPDGRRLCYRSDRRGTNELQLFVADLAFDESTGAITGVAAEHQLTDNTQVNWAPFWHPSGELLVYASSEVGHDNYEVFAINVPPIGPAGTPGSGPAPWRITHAKGFDGLPVFCDDGTYMMWTSQRGPLYNGETRPSSQVWVARVNTLTPAGTPGN